MQHARNEKRYIDGSNAQTEFYYDKNGNLIADFDRKICSIQYNVLSLPDTIQFSNGNQIVHVYDASGKRLQTTYYTRKVALVEPATSTLPGSVTNNTQLYTITSQTDVGNKRYKRYGTNGSWQLDYVFNPVGYLRFYAPGEHYPFYYIKDHIGNVRETYITPIPGEKYCEQRMQYYPSGLPWNQNSGASEQPFKYNGKEFIEMSGLDEYDSEARWYYPAIMRTTTMDPLCEKYYSTSPYAWCGNNPVNYIDPDGMNPIYDLDGNFLGVDEYGYDGDIYVMDSKLFVPGMEHVYSKAWNVGLGFVNQKSLERILSNVKSWPDKPDYDGKLTFEEANNWYRVGNGEPLCIPITSIDLSKFCSLGEAYVGKTYCYNLLIHGSLNDGLVFGNITFKRHPNHQVRAFPDTYDFDIKQSYNPLIWLRNIETRIGKKVAGEGQAYQIQIYGSQALMPLFPWVK